MKLIWQNEGPFYLARNENGVRVVLGRCTEARELRVEELPDAEFLYCKQLRLTQLGTLTWVHQGLPYLMGRSDIVWNGVRSEWCPVAFDPLLLKEGEPVLADLLLVRANTNTDLTIPKLLKIRSMLISS